MTLRPGTAVLFAALVLAACGGGEATPLLAQLNKDFQPGLTVGQAQDLLKTRGAASSLRSAAECEALVKEARVPTQISPRGGPCVFGKIPVARGWFGAHTDVILQLVFGADGKLVDASFEEIASYL
ncbi:MAG: hypothetical protein PHY45_11340 [Rhodocyclaceae bacterium]|nr:hypothetical protein [Rhodocyclaceae bacterium]